MFQSCKPPPPLHPAQEMRELEQMNKQGLIDLARGRGLTYNGKSGELHKSDLEAHICKAQSFAASLRDKHPSSCEGGVSARGDWWGFAGDYQVLDHGDLETEAAFAGLAITFYNA